MTKAIVRTDARFARGDSVRVDEQGIRPWLGRVSSAKFSPVSGWWLEVRRDDDGGTYNVTEDLATLIEEEAKTA